MAEDAARSGAQSDADSTTGDQNTDAGSTGDQPDIDKIVAARLSQKLKSLNVDELKRKAAEYDRLEESQKTEAERLQARIAELEKANADLERTTKETRLRTSAVSSAARLGFRDPDDAFRLLDLQGIEYDDNGNPKDIDKQLDALAKAKPYLVGGRSSGSADGGRQGQPVDPPADMNAALRALVKSTKA